MSDQMHSILREHSTQAGLTVCGKLEWLSVKPDVGSVTAIDS